MPPNSLYCNQKSLSRISAAAANLSKAASPVERVPLAKAVSVSRLGAMAIPAAIRLFFANERRLRGTFKPSRRSFIGISFLKLQSEDEVAVSIKWRVVFARELRHGASSNRFRLLRAARELDTSGDLDLVHLLPPFVG